MNLHVDVECAQGIAETPSVVDVERWVDAAVHSIAELPVESAELAVRIVDADESRRLNHAYRGKDTATNVLAFPADVPAAVTPRPFGDLVLCAEVIRREATEQRKTLAAHYAHMLVHGSLHLLGFDHDNAAAATVMEAREVEILRQLGYSNPYTTAVDLPLTADAASPR